MNYINAHTHLELTVLADLCPQEGMNFTKWIVRLLERRSKLTNLEIQRGIDQAIATLHDNGTIAVGDITNSRLSVEPLLASGLAGVVYLEVLGLDRDPVLQRFAEIQREIDDWRKHENAMKVGLTVHAPYSCAPELFVAATRWCIDENVPLTIHIAESADEVAYLRDGSGGMAAINQWLTPHVVWNPPHLSPIQYLHQLGVLEAKPVLVHGVQVDDADLAIIKASGCVMVHCPRSNTNLDCGRMPLERYLAHDIPLAMGTDSLSSCQSLDMRDEIAYAKKLHGKLIKPSVLKTMATAGGRKALNLD
ncbi:MAG: amidohydrolase family protein [Herpetosiphon sp.]|nr:amidohydrolase family protein [Herpetosiphon sp.]